MPYQVNDVWLAGFFDGEGCVTVLRPTRGDPLSQVDLCQKNIGLLQAIQEKYEGTIGYCYNIPPIKWFSRDITKILNPILPHLVLKRGRADLALQMLDTMPGRGYPLTDAQRHIRGALADAIQELNHGIPG